MQTISGAIGFLDPLAMRTFTAPGKVTFSILQVGPSADMAQATHGQTGRSSGYLGQLVQGVKSWLSKDRPAPWNDIGIITFDASGRRLTWKINGLMCGQIELDTLKAFEESGYPLAQVQRPNLARFAGKVASQIGHVGDLQAVLDHPVHLPWTGERILRATPLAGVDAAASLPPAWRAMLPS